MPELEKVKPTNPQPTANPSVVSQDIQKVEEEIELTKKKQELEAINAGYKTTEDFKKAIATVEKANQELEQQKLDYITKKASLEADRKAFEEYKAKEKALIAQGQADNVKEKERILKVGEEYKKKWKLEDDKRRNENKLIISHLDDLAKAVYNIHPQYLGKLAKDKLAEHLVPILNYFAIPPKFNKNGEYIILTSQLENVGKEISTTRNESPDLSDDKALTDGIEKAYNQCTVLYKWLLGVSGAYNFTTYLYKELKFLDVILHDKTPEELAKSLDVIMEHFGRINKELIATASQFDRSNHPNRNESSPETEYMLRVSDEIERLLGVKEE